MCRCKGKDKTPINCCYPEFYMWDVISRNLNLNNSYEFFFGTGETTFKEIYKNYCRDIKRCKYKNSTELAKYI